MKAEQLEYYNQIKPKLTYFCGEEDYLKLKKSGAKMFRLYCKSNSHENYEGRRKNKRDYFLGRRIETDECDFVYMADKE